MEIKPPYRSLSTSNIKAPGISQSQLNAGSHTPSQWQTTKQIQAVITKITENQILLDINGIKAHTSKPALLDLHAGDILKLQVERLKPTPQFTIIGLQKSRNFNANSQYINSTPQQQSNTANLLKNISYVANRPALKPSPLPVEVNAMIRDIFNNIPAPYSLKTGTQLKAQLQNSGLFIESKIKNELLTIMNSQTANKPHLLDTNVKAIFKNDLAAQLHRLASLLKTYPQSSETLKANTVAKNTNAHQTQANNLTPQQQNQNTAQTNLQNNLLQNISQREEAMQTLLRQVDSNLTHLQQTQLQNLNEAQSGRPGWLLELPIKDGQDIDLFEFKINQENHNNTTGEVKKTWNIVLKFNLEGLGEVKSHIKMYNDIISAQFISDNTNTLDLFNRNLELLRSRLNYNGLNVGAIDCRKSKPDEQYNLPVIKKLDELI